MAQNPTGPNNKRNPYYAKENQVPVARRDLTRSAFLFEDGGPVDPPVVTAPAVTQDAVIDPPSGPVGTDYTITPASYSGTSPITRYGVLRQNGVVVAEKGSGNAFTFTSTEAGDLDWEESGTNSAGEASSTASAIIEAIAIVAPTRDQNATISPSSGPVGTVFTIRPSVYSTSDGFDFAGTLTQDGVVVATKSSADEFTFTSTDDGPLVWSDEATNDGGSATGTAASTITAAVTQPAISDFYGVGAGQVPMDHKYAEGTKTNGNVTAVPNLGGAGSVFNLTTIGTVPVTGQVAELDPTDYFSMAGQADLVGVRFFMVADIHSTAANQYFGGQNESNGAGGKTNILLGAGGGFINITKNTGSNVGAQTSLSPVVSAGIRLYEIEMISGGNISVWVNGQLRGTTPNPHTSLLINRVAAGQSLSAGMNAGVYRTLSLITGGDYANRIATIRARLNEQYGLGM